MPAIPFAAPAEHHTRPGPVTFPLLHSVFAAVTAALFGLGTHAHATEWNGLDFNDNNWSSNGNWVGDAPPNDGSETVDFGALGLRRSPYADQPWRIKGITFETGAIGYEISGDELTIGSHGIRNYSQSKTHVVNNDIKLAADQVWAQYLFNFEGDKFTVNGDIDLNGYRLQLGTPRLSATEPASTVVLGQRSLTTGSGNLVIGRADFHGDADTTGDVTVYGLLHARSTSSFRVDDLTFGRPPYLSADPVLLIDGGTVRVDRLINASDPLTGRVVLTDGGLLEIGRNGSSFTYDGYFEGRDGGGTIVKTGAGTATLSTDVYTPSSADRTQTPSTIIRDGTLALTGPHDFDLDFRVEEGGTLALSTAAGDDISVGHTVTGESGVAPVSGTVAKRGSGTATIDTQFNNVGGNFSQEAGTTLLGRDDALSAQAALTVSGGLLNLDGHAQAVTRLAVSGGNIDLAGGALTVGRSGQADGDSTASGGITGAGTLVKTGLDRMELSGNHDFTGRLVVDEGTLALADGASTSAFIDLDVRTGGTLALANTHFFDSISGAGLVDLADGAQLSIVETDASGKSSVFDGTLRGAGDLLFFKFGNGSLTLTADQQYTGDTSVITGELVLDGALHKDAGEVQLLNHATLSGTGSANIVEGNGLLSPGHSPGVFTLDAVNVTEGMDFAFEMTAAAPMFGDADASLNDVLRLTDPGTPFIGSLDGDNVVSVYLDVDSLADNSAFLGGFYTDREQDFLTEIIDGAIAVYLRDAAGTEVFGGVNYAQLDMSEWGLDITTVAQSAHFEGDAGVTNGYISRFGFSRLTGIGDPQGVPEPATGLLLAAGAVLFIARRRRR